MRHILFSLLLCFLSSVNALHFYLDANQKRCFIEELPTDTVVEGTFLSFLLHLVLTLQIQQRSLPWPRMV